MAHFNRFPQSPGGHAFHALSAGSKKPRPYRPGLSAGGWRGLAAVIVVVVAGPAAVVVAVVARLDGRAVALLETAMAAVRAEFGAASAAGQPAVGVGEAADAIMHAVDG